MQGYMFGHMDAWSSVGKPGTVDGQGARKANGERAWTAAEIVAEAERAEGACEHIEAPAPPEIWPGTCRTFGDLYAALDDAANARVPTGKGKRKAKLRKDANLLLATVFSLPVETAEALEDPALMEQCRAALKAAAAWEQARVTAEGGEFFLAAFHTDETYLHVHCFSGDRRRGRVNRLHPGMAANDAYRARHGALTKQASAGTSSPAKEYRRAMRDWQDDLHASVFARFGLTRRGPRRQRMTRDEWNALKIAQEEAASVGERVAAIRAVEATQKEREAFMTEAMRSLEEETAHNSARAAELERKDEELQARVRQLEEREKAIAAAETAAARTLTEAAATERLSLRFLELVPPALLEPGVRLQLEGDDEASLTTSPNAEKKPDVAAAGRIFGVAPKKLRRAFAEMWTRATKAADDAAQAVHDGVSGPWSAALDLVRGALQTDEARHGKRTTPPDKEAPTLATLALSAAVRDGDPVLAQDLRQAALAARARQKMKVSQANAPRVQSSDDKQQD